MASSLKNLSSYDPESIPKADKMKFGIVVSEYNNNITFALRDGCIETLKKQGAKDKNIKIAFVPGTFELPSGAQALNSQEKTDALICLGCVIKGETQHDEYINNAVASGIMQLSLDLKKPVIFGVLTPNTLQQAKDRAGGKHGNKGVEAAVAAIKMVGLVK